MRVPGRWVNVALLGLFVITTTSGVLAFGVGDAGVARVVTAVHGAAGLGLLLLAPAKSRLVRRGRRRPGRLRKVIGMGLLVATVVAVASGLLHTLGGFTTYLGLLPMQLHVGAAAVGGALLVAHAVRHRRHPHGLPGRRPVVAARPHVSSVPEAGGAAEVGGAPGSGRLDPARVAAGPGRGPAAAGPGRVPADRRGARPWSRRAVLGRAVLGTGLVAGSGALWLAVPGLERRGTGSHEVGSGDPGVMPVTQWLFDPIPRIAELALRVPGGILDAAALAALPRRSERAVLDCTGGWWAEQEWSGVPLSALELRAGRSIDVVSVTGYRRRFPVADAPRLLLATHAAGRPLSTGHGGPLRLVAPGRRGFWWVKWVAAVQVVDEPWWWQPPFPLQ